MVIRYNDDIYYIYLGNRIIQKVNNVNGLSYGIKIEDDDFHRYDIILLPKEKDKLNLTMDKDYELFLHNTTHDFEQDGNEEINIEKLDSIGKITISELAMSKIVYAQSIKIFKEVSLTGRYYLNHIFKDDEFIGFCLCKIL